MNNWDEIFNKGVDFSPLNEVFLNTLLDRVENISHKKPQSLLDVGCGTGDTLRKFEARGFDVQGVDYSEVALGKTNISPDRLVLMDLDALDTSKLHAADLIMAKLVIAFIKDKETFLKKIQSIMKDDTVFALLTPVLYSNIQYTSEDKLNIAVPFDDINTLLKKIFSKVEIFDHNYFGARGDMVTYLCSK